MKRRSFVVGAGAASLAGLAGCTSILGNSGDFSEYEGTPQTVDGVELPVSKDKLSRGAQKDGIPAITGPSFGSDWSRVDYTLEDSEEIIGVERNGEARAYPIAVLDYHEIVNDEFDGPLLVSYCPLCGSGVVAKRLVDGEPTNFGVSGFLWKSDLVMYDEKTQSLWSQIFATAIRGEKTGTELEIVPFQTTSWGAWREEHPDGKVLLPPPESETITGDRSRNYDSEAYAGYDDSRRIGIGQNSDVDDRLHPKTEVIGVSAGDSSKAYPLNTIQGEGAINDTVGDRPVVVATGPDNTLVAYDRRVDGDVLSFRNADDTHISAGGSRWRTLTGEATDGTYEGTTLKQANDRSPMFWFAWAEFNPDTEIYRN